MKRPHYAVIGAGAFGGWTALNLIRDGASVTLVDIWGPGNSRASSGGDSRVIRHTYGPDPIYVRWTQRALEKWREVSKIWNRPLLTETGVLWMVQEDETYESASICVFDQQNVAYEVLQVEELVNRYPQVNFENIRWAIVEKEAGYLLARRSCEAVLQSFIAEGGAYKQQKVNLGRISNRSLESLLFENQSQLQADAYVFACGPWLGELFPEVLANIIRPTRQEIFYFGTPAEDHRYQFPNLPTWLDHGPKIWYGIPGGENRGFKIGDDTHGPPFDPTNGDRTPSPEGIAAARNFLAMRFPGMRDAPLLEARVCQYETTPDNHFIMDWHPRADNILIVGGGTGHGFKHGPIVGEYAANLVQRKVERESFFGLDRFSRLS